MSIRRLGRRIKPLSEKGTPGTPMRRISVRIDPDGNIRQRGGASSPILAHSSSVLDAIREAN